MKGLRRAVQVEMAAYLEGSEAPNPMAYLKNYESFEMTGACVWEREGDQEMALEKQAVATFLMGLQWVMLKS